LIGVDGYRSIVRRYLNPDRPFADYAGTMSPITGVGFNNSLDDMVAIIDSLKL
jgi:2-polyprenyl-6-methoxyphenol hydroxylase-like FAD-dependent oxidoreductase